MENNMIQQSADLQTREMTALSSTIQFEISPIVADAQAIADAVKDETTYQKAVAHGRLLKAKEKWAFEALDPFCKFFKGLHAKAVLERDSRVKPCQEGQYIIGKKTAAYEMEENRKRVEKEQQLAAEAKKRDDDAKLNAAQVMSDLGDKKAAEQILNMETVAPKIELPAVTAEGKTTRTNWNAECFDLMALLKAIVEGKQPIRFVEANMVMLNKEAKARKESMNKPGPDIIQGVRAISETKSSFRE